jgi:hypothetical protein
MAWEPDDLGEKRVEKRRGDSGRLSPLFYSISFPTIVMWSLRITFSLSYATFALPQSTLHFPAKSVILIWSYVTFRTVQFQSF